MDCVRTAFEALSESAATLGDLADCLRSGVRCGSVGLGTRTGAVVVRAGDAGLKPFVRSVFDDIVFLADRSPVFSSNVSLERGAA